MDKRFSRRRILVGGSALLGAGLTSSLLAACGDDDDNNDSASSNGSGSGGGDSSEQPTNTREPSGSSDSSDDLTATEAEMAEPTPEPDGHDPITITMWSISTNADYEEYHRANVEGVFEEANPNIDLDVNYRQYTNEVLGTALQGGEGPDLVPTGAPADALNYAQGGLFIELDGYAEQYGWADKILPWALDTGYYEGKLYSVAREIESCVLFYNRTLFEDQGWSVPTNRDELEALANECVEQDIIPFTAGNANFQAVTGWFVGNFLNHYAGSEAMYKALTGDLPWNDPLFVESMALLNDYFQNGWFGGSVQAYFATEAGAYARALLANGEAAMYFRPTNSFIASAHEFFGGDHPSEWDWTPIPPLRDGVADPLFELAIGSTLSISVNADDPDAAATYMDWIYSDKQRVAKWVHEGSTNFFMPVANMTEEDFPPELDERIARFLASFAEATAAGNIGYTGWTFFPPKARAFLYEGMDRVFAGDLTPEEFCDELDPTFQAELEEGVVPPTPPPAGM